VKRVRFAVDGAELGSDESTPFTWKWNSDGLEEGKHTLQVQAFTSAGLQAEDTIEVIVDKTPPQGGLRAPAFVNSTRITVETEASDARWMVLGNGWHWEGESLRHQSGQQIDDPAAANGSAWLMRAGNDAAGWVYGPYVQDLPTGVNYRAYFRLKSGDNLTTDAVALIDVVDDGGRNVYASEMLTGHDWAQRLTYEHPYLDWPYYRQDSYGLEFRTKFTGVADLYLDRIDVFRAPREYARSTEWTLPEGDGPKEVTVRYIDDAERVSEVYAATVVLDTVAPEWSMWAGMDCTVQDGLSGLALGSARYALSRDGGASWDDWLPLGLEGDDGLTGPLQLTMGMLFGTNVRLAIADRAGNVAESLALTLPPSAATPLPSLQPSATATSAPEPEETPTVSATAAATATPTTLPSETPTPTTEPSATPTALPTATATPPAARILGRITMDGRARFDGIKVSAGAHHWTLTDTQGEFGLVGLPAGVYTVTAEMAGYLQTVQIGVQVSATENTTLPAANLQGGDANGDCVVNLFDLIIVAASYGQPARDARADIDSDGRVDVRDLVLVSRNMHQACPVPWSP